MKTNKNTAYRKLIRTVSNHVKHYSFDMMIDFATLQGIEQESEKEDNVSKTFIARLYYRECGTWLYTGDNTKIMEDYASHSDRVFTLIKLEDNLYEISDKACR